MPLSLVTDLMSTANTVETDALMSQTPAARTTVGVSRILKILMSLTFLAMGVGFRRQKPGHGALLLQIGLCSLVDGFNGHSANTVRP